jgi:Xaa-Pro dipeptidase
MPLTRESLSASTDEIAEKERRVRDFLESLALNGLVFTTQASFAWFTCGADSHVGIGTDLGSVSLLITSDAKYIICDNIEAPRILDEELAGQGFEFRTYSWWESSPADEIAKLAKGPIGADTSLAGTRLLGSEIAQLRYSLTGPEVERYRWLGKASGECIAETGREIRPGMTEHEIAASLAEKLTARGVIANLILIAADERIEKYRHPIPTDRKLDRCAMLVIGAKKWGLVVSVTRIVHFGPIPAELQRKHEAVVTVDAELIARTRTGTPIDHIFRKGMEAYSCAGFPDEWKLHHQGGPTGYAGRDYRAKPGVKDIVHPNQAFAWNPSITGTKSEDTVIALEDRTEILSAHGDWPMRPVEVESLVVSRPEILQV